MSEPPFVQILSQISSRQFDNADSANPDAVLTFECFGVKVGVCSNKSEFLETVKTILPNGAVETELTEVNHRFRVQIGERDDQCVLFYNDREWLKDTGSRWITDVLRSTLRQRVAENTVERVFVHAGVVAWNDQAILIPGESFAGKTTLTAELVKAGAVYYSDEFGVIDRDGLIHPYQKPLSMRQRNSRDGLQTDVAVEHFNGTQGFAPLPIGLVVVTEYRAKAHWKPKVLSPGNGMLEMIKHTNNSLRHPEVVLPVLQKVAKQARIIKSRRGDAKKTARAILNECVAY